MKKLFFLLLVNLLAVCSFAQPTKVFTQALKDYDVKNIHEWNVLDENTYIVTAQIKKRALLLYMMFKITYNPEEDVYTAQKLDHSHNELIAYWTNKYCKVGDKIYRIRQKEAKKELCFYNDLLVGDRFQMASTPFFKTPDEYSGVYTGTSQMLEKDGSFFIMTEKSGTYTANEFKTETFQLVSSIKQTVPPNSYRQTHFIHKNQLISVFLTKQTETTYKLGFIVWSDTKTRHFFLDKIFDKEMVYDAVNQEDKVLLTVFNTKEKDLKMQLFDINFEDESAVFKHEYKVSAETLNKDYDADMAYANHSTDRYNHFKLIDNHISQINDENGDLYLFYHSYYTYPAFAIGDIMVVKISKGEFVWVQLVKRHARDLREICFPAISLEGDYILLRDHEPEFQFDKNGNYISGSSKKISLAYGYDRVDISINTESAEISRKLVPKP